MWRGATCQVLQWPADEIEARLRPNDTQRAALKALQTPMPGCRDPDLRLLLDAVTLPARVDAVNAPAAMQQRSICEHRASRA
jgi:hypothetical protein